MLLLLQSGLALTTHATADSTSLANLVIISTKYGKEMNALESVICIFCSSSCSAPDELSPKEIQNLLQQYEGICLSLRFCNFN